MYVLYIQTDPRRGCCQNTSRNGCICQLSLHLDAFSSAAPAAEMVPYSVDFACSNVRNLAASPPTSMFSLLTLLVVMWMLRHGCAPPWRRTLKCEVPPPLAFLAGAPGFYQQGSPDITAITARRRSTRTERTRTPGPTPTPWAKCDCLGGSVFFRFLPAGADEPSLCQQQALFMFPSATGRRRIAPCAPGPLVGCWQLLLLLVLLCRRAWPADSVRLLSGATMACLIDHAMCV